MCLLICLIVGYAILQSPDMVYTYVMRHHESSEFWMGFYKNYNLIVHLLMLAYGFRWFWGAIRVLKGNPDALTDEEFQRLRKARRIDAEKTKPIGMAIGTALSDNNIKQLCITNFVVQSCFMFLNYIVSSISWEGGPRLQSWVID